MYEAVLIIRRISRLRWKKVAECSGDSTAAVLYAYLSAMASLSGIPTFISHSLPFLKPN